MAKQSPKFAGKHYFIIDALTILAVIIGIFFFARFSINREKVHTRDYLRVQDLTSISGGLVQYHSLNNSYPSTDKKVVLAASVLSKTKFPSLSSLPSDPLNQDKYRYYYSSDGKRYALWARLESTRRDAINDKGVYNGTEDKPLYFEIGDGENWQSLIPQNLP